jgi:hypothetical protein
LVYSPSVKDQRHNLETGLTGDTRNEVMKLPLG